MIFLILIIKKLIFKLFKYFRSFPHKLYKQTKEETNNYYNIKTIITLGILFINYNQFKLNLSLLSTKN